MLTQAFTCIYNLVVVGIWQNVTKLYCQIIKRNYWLKANIFYSLNVFASLYVGISKLSAIGIDLCAMGKEMSYSWSTRESLLIHVICQWTCVHAHVHRIAFCPNNSTLKFKCYSWVSLWLEFSNVSKINFKILKGTKRTGYKHWSIYIHLRIMFNLKLMYEKVNANVWVMLSNKAWKMNMKSVYGKWFLIDS